MVERTVVDRRIRPSWQDRRINPTGHGAREPGDFVRRSVGRRVTDMEAAVREGRRRESRR